MLLIESLRGVLQVELAGVVSDSGLTLSSLVQRGQELARRLQLLQVDRREMACLKFLILFNPSESCLFVLQYITSGMINIPLTGFLMNSVGKIKLRIKKMK